ncbi:MAG TPA: malate dehydrogenase, partial [Promineifilum sp.]|nr:malate dehydrogenase [Promineifilum sp.]
FAVEAADVAMKAIEEGVARVKMSWQEVHDRALADIRQSREMSSLLMDKGFIPEPDPAMIEDALTYACNRVREDKKAQT